MLNNAPTVDNADRFGRALVERVDLFERVQDGGAFNDGAKTDVLLVQVRLRL